MRKSVILSLICKLSCGRLALYTFIITPYCIIDSTEIYTMNTTQYSQPQICRSNTYYVNPESTEIIELGTLEYPYKSIKYVFVEILNLHANSDRTINVILKEGTTDYIGKHCTVYTQSLSPSYPFKS